MERVRSIFRRNPDRRRAEDDFVEPNGINIEHTTHDQAGPLSQTQPQFESHSQRRAPAPPPQARNRGAVQQQAFALDGTGGNLPTTPAPRSGQLQIELQNDSDSSTVYAYISKLAPHLQTR